MKTKQGLLASQCGYGHLPLRVLKSNAGWYIGTYDEGIGIFVQRLKHKLP